MAPCVGVVRSKAEPLLFVAIVRRLTVFCDAGRGRQFSIYLQRVDQTTLARLRRGTSMIPTLSGKCTYFFAVPLLIWTNQEHEVVVSVVIFFAKWCYLCSHAEVALVVKQSARDGWVVVSEKYKKSTKFFRDPAFPTERILYLKLDVPRALQVWYLQGEASVLYYPC